MYFSHVALRHLKKNNFVSKFWPSTAAQKWGVSGYILEIITYSIRGRFRKTRSQRFRWVSSMVYCFAVDYKDDSNKTKGTSYHPFPKDHMLCKEWLAKISRENAKPNLAQQGFSCATVSSETFEGILCVQSLRQD